ncbi:MAG: helix-turn-helix domain-containing protein [bacterium]|nr:helix-turn-helix domain-containing protein [bacterium]
MKTLGQILREQREKKNITFEQAEAATKIRKSYLRDLENGNYSKLPASTYIKGFLKIYAEYLELPENDVMAFFRREFDESKDGKTKLRSSLFSVREPWVRLSPQVFFTVVFVSAIAVLFAYVWVQYQSFAGAPQLEIFSPKDGIVVQKPDIDVEGKTSSNSTLTLNGQNVALAQDGYFKSSVQMSEGVNVLTFVAVNEVGKSTTEKRLVRFDVVKK